MEYELKTFQIGEISIDENTFEITANYNLESGAIGVPYEKMYAKDSSSIKLPDGVSGKQIFELVKISAEDFVNNNYPKT